LAFAILNLIFKGFGVRIQVINAAALRKLEEELSATKTALESRNEEMQKLDSQFFLLFFFILVMLISKHWNKLLILLHNH